MAQKKAEVERTPRRYETIPFGEFEPLVKLAMQSTDSSESAVATAMGWDGSTFSTWRRTGLAPLRAKYTALGFLAELKIEASMASRPKTIRQFDREDLAWLFGMLIGLDTPQHRIEHLRKIIAAELAN